ncbi:Gfo/Idh/MocA family protein [Propionibacteriaceae bacterium Y2011]
MTEQVRAAIVGCGGLGRRHALNLAELDGADLSAMVDPSAESRDALARSLRDRGLAVPRMYDDVAALLADDRPDAVVVTTPNHTHSPVVVAAAQAGVHAFCEKPMALSVAECDAMITAAADAGTLLMIGYVRRYQAVFRGVKSLIDSGAIGEIHLASATRFGSGPPGGVGSWQMSRDTYGGMFSMYSHELDQLVWNAGPVTEVGAVLRPGAAPGDVEESALLTLAFGAGAVGSLGCTRIAPSPSYGLSFAGSEGSVTISDSSGAEGFAWARRGGEVEQVRPEPCNALADEIADFVSCVREGRQPGPDGESGRHVVDIARAADEAHATGQRITVGAR